MGDVVTVSWKLKNAERELFYARRYDFRQEWSKPSSTLKPTKDIEV
jgi:hypothetical protein